MYDCRMKTLSIKARLRHFAKQVLKGMGRKPGLYRRTRDLLYEPRAYEALRARSLDDPGDREMRAYTAEQPSPHYHALIRLYTDMHTHGYQAGADRVAAEKVYAGSTLRRYAHPIRRVFADHQVSSALDYGAGKGENYKTHEPFRVAETGEVISDLKSFWGVDHIRPFDPALGDEIPQDTYDAVLCTDVLEHVFAADVPWVVDGLFARAKKVVFVTVSCRLANARIPTGEQAHITLRAPAWWAGVFHATANRHPDVDYVLCCDAPDIKGNHENFWFAREGYERRVTPDTTFSR